RRPAEAQPFSALTRAGRRGPHADISLVADKLEAEAAGLARISTSSVAETAKALHAARRIWIAGFRSCRSVAELLNYQLRLFRSDEVQLVGGSGPEDLDLGAFQRGDAVVVIGFAPYSRASVLSARATHDSGATLVAIADAIAAPRGEGVWLIGEDGQRILDASGGAAVSCLGHQHPRVLEAMTRQASKLAYAHTSFFSSEPAEALADKLVGHEPGGLGYAYLVSGGSE